MILVKSRIISTTTTNCTRLQRRLGLLRLTRGLITAATLQISTGTDISCRQEPARTMGKRKEKSSSVSSPSSSLSPAMPDPVRAAFEEYEEGERQVLLELRELIFATARSDDRIGPLTETLKWNEPAYLTDATKAGSTLRLGHSKSTGGPALFVSCSTPLLSTIRALDTERVLDCHGLRDIGVAKVTEQNRAMLQTCMVKTLTYHLEKKDKNHEKKPSTATITSSSKKQRRSKTAPKA